MLDSVASQGTRVLGTLNNGFVARVGQVTMTHKFLNEYGPQTALVRGLVNTLIKKVRVSPPYILVILVTL